MKPIAVFYHGLISHGNPRVVRPVALSIIDEATRHLKQSGLLDAASEVHVGMNADETELHLIKTVIPEKAKLTLHGMNSFAENLTLVELEKWVKTHPDWYVLYFHAKGSTHDMTSDYARFVQRWRNCMLLKLVDNWKECVSALDEGVEAVGCHWMTGLLNGTQNIFAGNFWWATSDFLATLPTIFLRDRIKVSGIAAPESRYEAEVWIGNGPRLPKAKDVAGHGVGGCP